MSLKYSDLPQKHVMVMRVLQAFEDSTPEDKYEGVKWYREALAGCEMLAANTPYSVEQIAGIMAIASPGMVWAENETAPAQMVDLHWNGIPSKEWSGFSTYPHNLFKAERVLDEDFDAISGDKVTSFYKNIMGDTNAVTIDRWMVRIMMDDPFYGTKRGGTHDKATFSSSKPYHAMADAVRIAAELIGLHARDLQAIVWTYYRRLHLGRTQPRKGRMIGEMAA